MRKRTLARELALKILYQVDLTGQPAEEIEGIFWEENSHDQEVKEFAEKLVAGALGNLEAIDRILTKHAENWELKRMAYIDRNILRQATYELLYLAEEIPPKVVINEAVNVAKKYSQIESGKFVNGILDKINHTEERVHGPKTTE
ncbi:MAG TPA: transcription antitermination factor NusB [Candidatus Omnitrophota bacterium]|nr:transcription antitermination factor NusB [Candidatus Omnitrophota bacterium]